MDTGLSTRNQGSVRRQPMRAGDHVWDLGLTQSTTVAISVTRHGLTCFCSSLVVRKIKSKNHVTVIVRSW